MSSLDVLFDRLKRSPFRARFELADRDAAYAARHTIAEMSEHARRFVRDRLAPAYPPDDGRQTPFKGHPVFIAQHATATCCRSCLAKWHGIAKGEPLTDAQIAYIIRVIMRWLERHRPAPLESSPSHPTLFDLDRPH